MGVMDKFLNYMKLNGEEDDEYYDDDYLDEEDEEPAPPPRRASSKVRDMDDYEDDYAAPPPKKQPASSSKITPIKQSASRRVSGGSSMEVCVIKPTSVEDAREITETLLANRTVVLNLEGLDVEVAQRIIDFTSGSCFAISGNLQKISHYIFIITPASVDISGDFQDIFNDSFEMPLNT
ncbi:cell division protein SepF [Acetatifactor aquisgranensis]|uniref:cell division protein SepF n=1 Tax=Acetatifactor aquisgranensis TaxID=2941233 RepID=UPI00203E1230|nr:cell division protein SepF [Acetatifactor aquisgranensis]MCI8542526.1 cell division protein SepF [Lachnospiraceae bacterium]